MEPLDPNRYPGGFRSYWGFRGHPGYMGPPRRPPGPIPRSIPGEQRDALLIHRPGQPPPPGVELDPLMMESFGQLSLSRVDPYKDTGPPRRVPLGYGIRGYSGTGPRWGGSRGFPRPRGWKTKQHF